MSTDRGTQKKSQLALRDGEDSVNKSLELGKTAPQHV